MKYLSKQSSIFLLFISIVFMINGCKRAKEDSSSKMQVGNKKSSTSVTSGETNIDRSVKEGVPVKGDNISDYYKRIREARDAHNLKVFQSFDPDTFPIQNYGNQETYRFGLSFNHGYDTIKVDALDVLPYFIPVEIRESKGNPYVWHFPLEKLDIKTRDSLLKGAAPYKSHAIDEATYGYMQIGGGQSRFDWYPPSRYAFYMYSVDLLNEIFGIRIGGVSVVRIYNEYGDVVQEIVNKDFTFGSGTLSLDGKYFAASGGGLYGEGGGHSTPVRHVLYAVESGDKLFDSKDCGVGIEGNRISISCNDDFDTKYIVNPKNEVAYILEDYKSKYQNHTIWSDNSCYYLLHDTICFSSLSTIPLSDLSFNLE